MIWSIVELNRKGKQMSNGDVLAPPVRHHKATFTVEQSDVGNLYYFYLPARVPGKLTQRHVEAIIDIAPDGTLVGVELIDNMPPPPQQ